MSQFDAYAADYDAALNRGLSLSGESREYFATERVKWVSRCLAELSARPTRVLDFGSGTGGTCPELLRQLDADRVVGVDASLESLNAARRVHVDSRLEFRTIQEMGSAGPFDLVYCNGVFHHVPPLERPAVLAGIRRSLADDGYFAFWENNPWNPATRLVMSRIPFDRDAKLISPPRARSLLARAGFDVLRTDFLFFFPRLLAALRPLEIRLSRIPAGAQYLVLCRKLEC
ncbi:MAG TPA: class I SAM-dependent methyltransferase [Vicinamibacterales bacterium]|nr:class I SAM-dependent methyltransferase [Vicinamibacterales bacterium]